MVVNLVQESHLNRAFLYQQMKVDRLARRVYVLENAICKKHLRIHAQEENIEFSRKLDLAAEARADKKVSNCFARQKEDIVQGVQYVQSWAPRDELSKELARNAITRNHAEFYILGYRKEIAQLKGELKVAQEVLRKQQARLEKLKALSPR